MSLSKVVPLITKEGHEYLIEFSPNPIFKYQGKLTIINLVITFGGGSSEVNNARSLFQITNIIKQYLTENDVVLYCYCDEGDIYRSKRRHSMPPQEFRSNLFSSMFEKIRDRELINEVIIIDDPARRGHFIHLFGKRANQPDIESIKSEITQLNEK